MRKPAVSALLFDYVLTGPISGVSAGQYIIGLILETLSRVSGLHMDEASRVAIKNWGLRRHCLRRHHLFPAAESRGIHESSSKALKIMIITTVNGRDRAFVGLL